MRLLFVFIASVVLTGVGGAVFVAGRDQLRGGGVSLIGLGVLLLVVALMGAANSVS